MSSDVVLDTDTITASGDLVRFETTSGVAIAAFDLAGARVALGAEGVDVVLAMTDDDGRERFLVHTHTVPRDEARAVQIDAGKADIVLGALGADGDLLLRDADAIGRVLLTADSAPWTGPDIALRAVLDGRTANLTLGGAGSDGDILMRRADGAISIGLNASTGALHLGATNQDGDLLLYKAGFRQTVHLDGASGDGIFEGTVQAKRADVADEIHARGRVRAGRVDAQTYALEGDTRFAITAPTAGEAGHIGWDGGARLGRGGLVARPLLPVAGNTVADPKIFIGDMRASPLDRDPDRRADGADLRAALTTDGALMLGGNGAQGRLEVRGADGLVKASLGPEVATFGGEVSVRWGSGVADRGLFLRNSQLRNDYATGSEGTQILPNQVVLRADPNDTHPLAGCWVLLRDKQGLNTLELSGADGKVRARSIEIEGEGDLLARIAALEAKVADLERKLSGG